MVTSPDSVTSNTQVTATMIGPATVDPGLTATGSTQADALPVWADEVIVTTCPVGAGIILKDKDYVVENRAVNALLVYPQLDAQVETYGINIAVSIPSGGAATFKRVSPTLYRVR